MYFRSRKINFNEILTEDITSIISPPAFPAGHSARKKVKLTNHSFGKPYIYNKGNNSSFLSFLRVALATFPSIR